MKFLNFYSHFILRFLGDRFFRQISKSCDSASALNSLQFNLLLVTISHTLKLDQNNTPLYPAPKYS